MTVQAFEQLVNAKGLVPMMVTDDNFAPYEPDHIYGFPPETAARLYAIKSAYPVDESGEPAELPLPMAVDTPADDPRDLVEIPEDWRDLNPRLKLVPLARQLLGMPEGAPLSREDAVAAIEAEVQRRNPIDAAEV